MSKRLAMKWKIWKITLMLLLVAWIPPFIPDAWDYVLHIPPRDDLGMLFVSVYTIFVTLPLTAIAVAITLYKAITAAVKLRAHDQNSRP